MNNLLNITKKELKELLTIGSLASILVMVFVFMGVGTMMSENMDEVTKPSHLGFMNGDPGGDWSDITYGYIVDIYVTEYGLTEEEAKEYIVIIEGPYGDNTAIVDQMIDAGIDTAMGLVPGYSANINNGIQGKISEYYIFSDTGILDAATMSIVTLMVQKISHNISEKLVSDLSTPSEAPFLLNPIRGSDTHTYINGQVHDGITPLDISQSMIGQSMMVPLVIMIVIMMIGSIIISSMGNEKENKTLETLLTLPVKRTTIVSGKLLGSAITGMIFGLLYMVGMVFYMNGLSGTVGGKDLSEYGLNLGVTDWAIIALMIFLAIFCALGLCMILGAFAKSYKAAQTMTLPISALAMIPMFVTMFSSWGSLPAAVQVPLFAIPFTHPMMVMDNLMFGNFDLVLAGLVYLVIFAVVTILITVKLYNSDILLTGIGQTKIAGKLSRKKG
ncbi:MAG: ABC transporter permease [Candidatus Methanoplasma sp.]|jgi:ABC-2 type transport system permease protein|nr:ABC transporter permease [Candidatus Methanoplasma sp.]